MAEIIFTPDYTSRNPYQRELAGAVARRGGHKVSFANASGVMALSRLAAGNGRGGVIHVHWINALVPSSRFGVIAFLKRLAFRLDLRLARLLGGKLAWTVHNALSHGCANPRAEIFARRELARNCDAVIVHCQGAKRELSGLYGFDKIKFSVIPHGHYMDSYANTVGKAEARRYLGIPQDRLLYACVGSIKRYKGCLGLIDAFARLEAPAKQLLIAGEAQDSRYAAELRSRAGTAEDIKLVFDFIKPESMQYYMNAADIIVLPYERILNSGAAILAMSFGKALVAPRMGCLPEAVPSGGAIFFEPASPESLLAALESAARADLAAMGMKNSAGIRECGWDKIAEQTLEAYRL